MAELSAEAAYLFRHVALRDAAYQLHMPSERARLHELAIVCITAQVPESELDALAHELAGHARNAQLGVAHLDGALARAELAWLGRAAAFAEREYDNHQAAEFHQRMAAHAAALPEERAHALVQCGMLQWFLGRREAALDSLTRAARTAEDRNQRALALIERGVLYRDTREYYAAEADLREALRLAEVSGNARLQLRALGNLATVIDRGFAVDDVIEMYQPVLALAEKLGVRGAVGVSYGQIGHACMANHEYERAVEWVEKALAIARESNDQLNEAVMLVTLALALMRREGDARADLARARELLERSIAVNAAIGNTPQSCSALAALSTCCRRMQRLDEAQSYARRAIQLATEVGNPESLASAWRELGRVYEERGEEVEAERAYSYGIVAVQDAPEYSSLVKLLLALASLLARRGEFADAAHHAESALELASDHYDGALAEEVRALLAQVRAQETPRRGTETIVRRKK